MKKVYAEAGFGNESFLSTEFEYARHEERVRGFILPEKIKEAYLRIWIFKRVLIISFFSGIFLKKKDKNQLKILFGLGGTSK